MTGSLTKPLCRITDKASNQSHTLLCSLTHMLRHPHLSFLHLLNHCNSMLFLFTGAHGTRYDFNGELGKAFCLITDKTFHLNAVLKGYKNDNAAGGATVGADGKAIRSWIR